jgi:hypothetical protein
MSINFPKPKNFTPASAGAHSAVCCDVVDLGQVKNNWLPGPETVHKIKIVWQVDETDPETGKPITTSRSYTLSQHPQSSLRKDLESWRGRPFTKEELRNFDIESLVGARCLLTVVHNTCDDGTVYANVASVAPPHKSMPKLSVTDYVRVKDREPAKAARPKLLNHPPQQSPVNTTGEDVAAVTMSPGDEYQATDSDVPF